MNNNLRKTVFFILLLAVTYLAYQFMIKPANKSLAEQQTQVDKKLSKLNEFEKATTAVEDLNAQLIELQNAIDSFESKLPPKSEIVKTPLRIEDGFLIIPDAPGIGIELARSPPRWSAQRRCDTCCQPLGRKRQQGGC